MLKPCTGPRSPGRVCYGIELNPAYVDVAVERWQQFTGKDAILEGQARTFADAGQERDGAVQDSDGSGSNASSPASA